MHTKVSSSESNTIQIEEVFVCIWVRCVFGCGFHVFKQYCMYIPSAISPSLQDPKAYFCHPDCTNTAQAPVTNVPLIERVTVYQLVPRIEPRFCMVQGECVTH